MSTQKLLHSEEEFDKIGRAPQLSPTKDHLLNGLKMQTYMKCEFVNLICTCKYFMYKNLGNKETKCWLKTII